MDTCLSFCTLYFYLLIPCTFFWLLRILDPTTYFVNALILMTFTLSIKGIKSFKLRILIELQFSCSIWIYIPPKPLSMPRLSLIKGHFCHSSKKIDRPLTPVPLTYHIDECPRVISASHSPHMNCFPDRTPIAYRVRFHLNISPLPIDISESSLFMEDNLINSATHFLHTVSDITLTVGLPASNVPIFTVILPLSYYITKHFPIYP